MCICLAVSFCVQVFHVWNGPANVVARTHTYTDALKRSHVLPFSALLTHKSQHQLQPDSLYYMLIRSKSGDASNDSSGDLAFALLEFERRSALQAATDCRFLPLESSWCKKRRVFLIFGQKKGKFACHLYNCAEKVRSGTHIYVHTRTCGRYRMKKNVE